ncbi:MAG: DNA replication/repair protein RecF [Candidatus Sumerlaeia bacterium]
MRLEELSIRNIRNIEALELKPHPRLNIICGANGAGKTNLLEAVYLLATGRSFRTANDRELIRWEGAWRAEFALAAGTISAADGSVRQARVVISGGQKRVFLNDKQAPTLAAYWGELNAVVFTPDDLLILKGDPAKRRAFMDSELSQLNGVYLRHLQQYAQALRQRNALLRSGASLAAIAGQLSVWERTLSELSVFLFRERRLRVSQLESHAKDIYTNLTDGREQLRMRYIHFLLPLSEDASEDESDDTLKEAIAAALEEGRRADFERGFTQFGPHRDDFIVTLDGLNARHYASQGQQRSCMLAIRLAELHLFLDVKGEYPIVMLDDISSELDERRRECLSTALPPEAQKFITTVTPETLNLPENQERSVFWLRRGRLR